MLALTRQKDTSILIGQDIVVTFRGFQGDEEAICELSLPSGCALSGPNGTIETQPSDEPGVSRALVCLKKEESIQIGDDVTVKVVRAIPHDGLPYDVRLGIDAPAHVAIIRHELTEAGQKEMPPATETQDDSGRNQ